MSLYRDEGVVLRTMRLGEADRIVTMLCRTRGKVRAVAKGVRKTTSRFGGRLEPLSHVSLLCWQGRELDIVNQVEVIDSNRAIREDLDRVTKAFSMLEVADRVSVEMHSAQRLYELLVNVLSSLAANNAPLVLPAFLPQTIAVIANHGLCTSSPEAAAPGAGGKGNFSAFGENANLDWSRGSAAPGRRRCPLVAPPGPRGAGSRGRSGLCRAFAG